MTKEKERDGAPGDDSIHQRASLYRLFGHLYRRELTKELIAELWNSGILAQLESQGYTPGLESAAEVDDADITKLRTDYARIIVGPGPHVPPYGSVHHPKDPKRGSLWGDTTKAVNRLVKHYGLDFKKGYGGIPDHIGVELEFFSALLQKETALRAEGDTDKAEKLEGVQRDFFNDHINQWVPRFCEKVIKAAGDESPFYRALARVTRDFLATEAEQYAPPEAAT